MHAHCMFTMAKKKRSVLGHVLLVYSSGMWPMHFSTCKAFLIPSHALLLLGVCLCVFQRYLRRIPWTLARPLDEHFDNRQNGLPMCDVWCWGGSNRFASAREEPRYLWRGAGPRDGLEKASDRRDVSEGERGLGRSDPNLRYGNVGISWWAQTRFSGVWSPGTQDL